LPNCPAALTAATMQANQRTLIDSAAIGRGCLPSDGHMDKITTES
jgi:hypothetical protein